MTQLMPTTDFDLYLPAPVRAMIEERYYARINAQARIDQVIHDPTFLRDPARHVALWSDHGVVHVRDVAQQALHVLEVVHGQLIPRRSSDRYSFMQAYVVMVAYVHDIGMMDFSLFGRVMHPEFAAQEVFRSVFDPIVNSICQDQDSPVMLRLTGLVEKRVVAGELPVILRELLSLACCHSKSKVPVHVLNEPTHLRSLLQQFVSTDLRRLYYMQRIDKARQELSAAHRAGANDVEIELMEAVLSDAEQALALIGPAEAVLEHEMSTKPNYTWLASADLQLQTLAQDVIDTLRVLRCADSLRQRGTVLKTSGSYEVFVDRRTANAVFALRWGDDKLYLLESADALSAGEANIASSELRSDGSLRIAFHRGSFSDKETTLRAASNTALVVSDILWDVVESFRRQTGTESGVEEGLWQVEAVEVCLEETDDNLEFASLVRDQVQRSNPALRNPIRCVPSLQYASSIEVSRYLEGKEVGWTNDEKQSFIERLDRTGQKLHGMNLTEGFRDVRLIDLPANETLVEAGSPAAFVYIPLGDGLKVIPLGGYQAFCVNAWMPLGNTGIIRGAYRNATVVADQDVQLVMIPKETYFKYWYRPYSPEEFRQLFSSVHGS